MQAMHDFHGTFIADKCELMLCEYLAKQGQKGFWDHVY